MADPVLIAGQQDGEKRAREVLIEKHLGLVRHVAARFAGRGVPPEDLFQIGVIGLMKAVDRFEPERGVCFSTYAVPLIMGEIRLFLRADTPVKISRRILENRGKVLAARLDLTAQTGREPGILELSEATGLEKEDVLLALEAKGAVESLDEVPAGDGEQTAPLSERLVSRPDGVMLAGKQDIRSDPEKDMLIDRMTLKDLLEALPTEDRQLIGMRYFQDKTQTEVSKKLGISQVQVSRRERKILAQLRERLTDSGNILP